MNREEAAHFAKVLQAYAEGKTIQIYVGEWRDLLVSDFSCSPKSYRIKLEPKRTAGYRSYYYSFGKDIFMTQVWDYPGEYSPSQAQERDNFIKWKHTEWQYDDVEVE